MPKSKHEDRIIELSNLIKSTSDTSVTLQAHNKDGWHLVQIFTVDVSSAVPRIFAHQRRVAEGEAFEYTGL